MATAPTPTFEQFLHHPDVVAAIDRVRRKYGCEEQDLEDARHDVMTKALEWDGERPSTLEGTKALCIVIAHRLGASAYRRKKMRERKGDAGAVEVSEETAIPQETRFDGLDREKLIALLDRTVPAHVRELFEDVADGAPQTELAERAGGYRKVRKTLEKSRAKYRAAVLASGMGLLLVAGAAWMYVRGDIHASEQAHPTPSASASQVLVHEKPQASQPPAPTPQQQAAELRRHARELCADKKWKECLDAYDDAANLDPAGETTQDKKLRDDADRQLMAKPTP